MTEVVVSLFSVLAYHLGGSTVFRMLLETLKFFKTLDVQLRGTNRVVLGIRINTSYMIPHVATRTSTNISCPPLVAGPLNDCQQTPRNGALAGCQRNSSTHTGVVRLRSNAVMFATFMPNCNTATTDYQSRICSTVPRLTARIKGVGTETSHYPRTAMKSDLGWRCCSLTAEFGS
jgi:hypothetical protein